MLREIRRILAAICFLLITLLFVDFTGILHLWFGWLAKIQFLPAVLALNAGVILFLVLLTLVGGRIYCSVICPLGVFQDIVARIGKGKKKNALHLFQAQELAAVCHAHPVGRCFHCRRTCLCSTARPVWHLRTNGQ